MDTALLEKALFISKRWATTGLPESDLHHDLQWPGQRNLWETTCQKSHFVFARRESNSTAGVVPRKKCGKSDKSDRLGICCEANRAASKSTEPPDVRLAQLGSSLQNRIGREMPGSSWIETIC